MRKKQKLSCAVSHCPQCTYAHTNYLAIFTSILCIIPIVILFLDIYYHLKQQKDEREREQNA
jgi:hypothetical protein